MHRKFSKRKKVKQQSFNAHFPTANDNGEDDWELRLIDQTYNVEDLTKRESFWHLELEIFLPNGLNERKFWYLPQLPFCNFDPQYLLKQMAVARTSIFLDRRFYNIY